MKKAFPLALLALSAAAYAFAQDYGPTAHPPQGRPAADTAETVPLYRIQVVGRDIPAINYYHRSSSTAIAFRGTSLLPEGKGRAEVQSRRGRMTIAARFAHLVPANSFGQEYLTYVLWAITPEGRPVNLGEVLPDGSKGALDVTTDLQTYGLVVTAEPYFAVTMPSDVVVLQNGVIKHKTKGIIDTVNVHYTLLPRGAYVQTAGQHAVLNPITRTEKSPLELYEAINAVQIAQAAGAMKYSPDILDKAKQELSDAQDLDTHHGARKREVTYARAAVQDAEDARLVTLRRMQAEERAAATAEQRAKQEAAEKEAQQAQMRAQQAQLEAAQAAAQRAEAEAHAAQAQAAQAAAERNTQQAQQQTEQMRERLREQLNNVLQTQETARGLIVNLSDVLFGSNKYTVKPDAREKLAKVSGILLAYPDLNVQVEGYTDNVGGKAYNQKLSEERAGAVRDYLVTQGVSAQNVTSTGYGEANPVADNAAAAGRAKNRRVQLVVSGAAIGVGQQSAPSAGEASARPAPNQSTRPSQYQQPHDQQQQEAAPAQMQPPAPAATNSGVSNPPGEHPQ
jgi:outer membrane protein OmpA-like peptidoglycan-associated protein